MSSILDQIKETVLGVKSNKIDSIIDDSLTKIDKFTASEDKNKFIEHMKKLISTSGADGNSLLKSLSVGNPQVQQYDNSGRIARYNEYESICAKIPYCFRALECWVDHIVSPDEILKTSLQICPFEKDDVSDKTKIVIGRLNTICKHFDLDNKIRNIIRTTLKLGDNFIELVKTPNGANTLVVLNEGFDPAAYTKNEVILEKKYTLIESHTYNDRKIESKKSIKIVIDESSTGFNLGGVLMGLNSNLSTPTFDYTYKDISGSIDPISKANNKSKSSSDYVDEDKFKNKYDKLEKDAQNHKETDDFTKLQDISMVIHDPRYVIRLETKRFKVCLGYLVFPKVDLINVQSGVVNNIDAMCAQLLSDVKRKLNSKGNKVDDDINVSEDIKKVLLVHLQHIEKNDDLKIRYVNPDLMQHFKTSDTKYYPYGTSIFDPVLFACRMYIAQKTAAVVKQINASTDKRFISLEIGLPRDAKNAIEQMKEQISKKRITVDSLGNTDTIPSQISTWENIFIPMKDGKKYVEIDHQQWSPNANEDTEALKNAANEIVGDLGVPATYLNITEQSGNRATLTAESINWARAIIAKQQELTPCVRGFFNKVYCLVWGKDASNYLSSVQITFQMPRIAPMTNNIEFIENSSRVVEALSGLGLSKEYLKRQYMPYVDWDHAESDGIIDKINKETGEAQDASMDMMGGGMGMMPTGGGMDMGGGMM